MPSIYSAPVFSASKTRSELYKCSCAVFLLVMLCQFVEFVTSYSLSYRQRVTSTGKIRADLPGVELGDYRFGLGEPYVIMYERDNYRGAVHFQVLGKQCKNIPEARQNWASSIDVQKRCITVCDELDCTGNCSRIYAHPEDPNNKGASKLSAYNLNDKVKSLKFCYS